MAVKMAANNVNCHISHYTGSFSQYWCQSGFSRGQSIRIKHYQIHVDHGIQNTHQHGYQHHIKFWAESAIGRNPKWPSSVTIYITFAMDWPTLPSNVSFFMVF